MHELIKQRKIRADAEVWCATVRPQAFRQSRFLGAKLEWQMASSPTKEFKICKEKAALNCAPLLKPEHWSPSSFSLPSNFTNKLPHTENVLENHLA